MAERTPPQILTVSIGDDRILPKTKSSDWYEAVRDMRTDPTIALARAIAIAPILLAPWSVEKESTAPDGAQEFIARQMQPLRIHILKNAFAGCIDFGWQPFEKIFGVDREGFTILRKLKPLLHDITEILVDKRDGSFIGFQQDDPESGNPIQLTTPECLLLNFDVEGTNWYGVSLMENVYQPYTKWEQCEEGADRYDRKMAGTHWVIRYPLGESMVNGALKDNVEIARQIMISLESSGMVAIPSTISAVMDDLNSQAGNESPWSVDLLTDSGGQTGYIERMKYLDALKVRAFGLPERAILEGQFGTKAEADVHGDLGITLMETRHETIVQQLNWHLVNQLLRFNYGEEAENSVYIKASQVTDTAKSFLRELFKTLLTDPTNALILMDKVDQEALMDRLSIPVKPNNPDEPGVTDTSRAPPAGDDDLDEDPDDGLQLP